jgi:hypothetical protein
MLGQDFLSPVSAYLLYPDLLQRFLFFPVPRFDRARALELGWERAGREQLHTEALAQPFLALWSADSPGLPLPALLLNSTRVQTGQRAIISNLDLSKSAFLDTVDLLGKQKQDALHTQPYSLKDLDRVPLSTAIHLSARFTYVSPAATIDDEDGHVWDRLVDGGYFENSGAATLAELVEAVCQRADDADREWHCGNSAPGIRVFPVVLLIKNDPQSPAACTGSDAVDYHAPTALLSEVRSPIDALLATREARGRLAENELGRLLGNTRLQNDRTCSDGCVLEFSLARPPQPQDREVALTSVKAEKKRYADPPLGWSLSETSRLAMDSRLREQDIKAKIHCVAQLINAGRCDKPPDCPN